MRLKTLLITLVLLFTICSNLYAQISKKEIELLKKSVTHYANTNTDSLIYFAKKLQGSNYIGDQLEGLSAESKAYYQLKDYSKSESISNQILSTPNINSYNLNDQLYIKRKKIIAYNRLFWIEINRENYNKAYFHILEAEKLNTEFLFNSDIYYRYRLNIETSKALIKSKLNMHDEAKNILLNINTEIESSNIDSYEDYNAFSIQKANVLNSLGNSYLALYNQNQNKTHIDSAAVFFDKAYSISKTFDPPHKDSKIIYSLRKTEVLIAKEEYKKAINLINTYTHINKEFDSEHFQYFQKAICFYNLKNIDSTLYFSNRFLTTKRDKCKPSSLITIYDILSNQYYALNKVDSAYKYSTLTLKEFNHAKKNKDKTFQLLYKNDFAKASALNKSIIQKESNRKNIQMLFYVLSLLVLFSIFFYLQKKQESKKGFKNRLSY